MGYTTDFSGSLTLSRQLTDKEREYLKAFAETRRMKRSPSKLMEIYKGEYGYPHPEIVGPNNIYGEDGEYFVGDSEDDGSVIDVNTPPGQVVNSTLDDWHEVVGRNLMKIKNGQCQPGLWAQWVINNDNGDGDELCWDGGEKFYKYIDWLRYYIKHFFDRWGIDLNGEIEWMGEDTDDRGKIVVENNKIEIYEAVIKVKYKKVR